MAKPEFAAVPILNLTSIGLWSGDTKRPTSGSGARKSRCFGVATFLYRADKTLSHSKYLWLTGIENHSEAQAARFEAICSLS